MQLYICLLQQFSQINPPRIQHHHQAFIPSDRLPDNSSCRVPPTYHCTISSINLDPQRPVTLLFAFSSYWHLPFFLLSSIPSHLIIDKSSALHLLTPRLELPSKTSRSSFVSAFNTPPLQPYLGNLHPHVSNPTIW